MGCFCGKENKSPNRRTRAHNSMEQLDADQQLLAALLIQRWYRKYTARLETRRRATWQVFQTLEYKNEKDQMSLYNFFNDLLLHAQGDDNILTRSLREEERPPVERDLLATTDPAQVQIEDKYTGIHLTFPLDANQLPKLVTSFAQKERLHAKYVLQILHETRKLLKGMASWHQVPLGNLPHVTIVGDIHGQMDDLQLIFYKNGFPDRMNPYIFNGDIVDRGEYSIEVAMLIFAYFIVYPKSVFINRGNHEDQVMNMRYGFVKEAMMKYNRQSAKIVTLFAEVFSWLPICTVIDKKILVCHGGISNKTNLAEIDKLDRHQYMSVLNPPQNERLPEDDPNRINFAEWRQILDMLWSDPKAQNGCEPNHFRGGGCYFGPDICNMVLKKHRFKMLIRSHECKPEGYEWCHNGLTLTIFSASNYYEDDSNKGAYIRITKDVTRGGKPPEIFQFQVKAGHTPSLSSKVTKTEDSALASLKDKIFTLKCELLTEFAQHDKKNYGCITVSQWCESMKTVTGLDLPWRILKPKLIQMQSKNKVDYKSMFENLRLQSRGKNVQEDMEALYKHRNTLNQIFNTIDKDRSGLISRDEFIQACKVLRRATKSELSDKEIKTMARNIDINQDGQIDVNEFLEAFTLVAKNAF